MVPKESRKIDGKSTGYFSDISITSFYGSHEISCAGNGGMLVTNNKNIFTKSKILRSWGRLSTLMKDSENIKDRLNIKLKGFDFDRKFVFSEAGYNFEPSEISASFGKKSFSRNQLPIALADARPRPFNSRSWSETGLFQLDLAWRININRRVILNFWLSFLK